MASPWGASTFRAPLRGEPAAGAAWIGNRHNIFFLFVIDTQRETDILFFIFNGRLLDYGKIGRDREGGGGRFMNSFIALKVASIYALAGGLWILFSDRLLEMLVQDPGLINKIQTIKGWLFILVTAWLVYGLVRRGVNRLLESEARVVRLNAELEALVERRTALYEEANKELAGSLAELERAQGSLIESEKMAALGGLVAGVSHEISTPLGVSFTATSFLRDKTRKLVRDLENGELKRSELVGYAEEAVWATSSALKNLRRAASLLSSFKQVSVDQTSEEKRVFQVRAYIEEVLKSLEPQFLNTAHEFRVDCPDSLSIESYPGAYAQILTNLVTNSLAHGFEGVEKGRISIEVSVEEGELVLVYGDDGRGMDDDTLKQVFNPFFTTRRGRGGTGLGMHIVYNIVSGLLKGQITCRRNFGRGALFTMRVPLGEEEAPGRHEDAEG